MAPLANGSRKIVHLITVRPEFALKIRKVACWRNPLLHGEILDSDVFREEIRALVCAGA